ncbi:hypothetical protein D4R78_02865 [bacterium]|nr:MAG: hypothetical protein D4R78_02865 [bacterium]
MSKKRKIPLGITLFGLWVILTSLLWIIVWSFNFNYYRYLFSPIPAWMIGIRYACAMSLRVLGFFTGLGVLRLSNNFRKVAIGILIFNASAIYWRHPYYAFRNHSAYLDRLFQNSHIAIPFSPSFSSLTGISVITACAIDIIFSLCFIYYFTRQRIKNLFR